MDTTLWANALTGLDSAEKAVLLNLAIHENPNDRLCFPSYQLIADETGLSKRTVIRAMGKLVEKGIVKKRTEQGYSSNLFTIIRLSPQSDTVSLPSDIQTPKECHHVTPPVTPCHPKGKLKETEPKVKEQTKPKQATLISSIVLTEAQEELITRFNRMCSKYSGMIIPVSDKDRQAMVRILTDKRPDGIVFTIDDLENMGLHLMNNADSDTAPFKWMPTVITSFKDLVIIGKNKKPHYQTIFLQSLSKPVKNNSRTKSVSDYDDIHLTQEEEGLPF